MITNKDLEIQNTSYTNKDFGQIYPEQLDLVKNLTNKWDPEATNESDPGIVLLKLNAFIGDKLNYNIDKNTLEQFIVSATQESSMRRLTEMLGYNMRYYRSATTKVNFRYLGELGKTSTESESDNSDTLSSQSNFLIKAFDTTFKTEDDIIYTLLEDITVTVDNKLCTDKLVIQGELKQLTVLNTPQSDTNLIQLYNLDDQNRLYFPDIEVAENGIFINKEIYSTVNQDAWRRVDNLNNQDLGSKVFKFGFDSKKNLPYIEFPKDISDIIGEGLEIWYILSSGENGKVLNNKLTKFNSIKITYGDSSKPLTSLDDDKYVLSNSSSTEAYNPESLTEAYNNFKRVVGTFNTLVSCRDYSNYVNSYVDGYSDKLVSNCVFTDLRTDPEYSSVTFIRDQTGSSYYSNIVKTDIDASGYHNLIVHGTIPVNQDIQTLNQYEKTYQKLNTENIIDIETTIDDVKTINHNLTLPKSFNLVEADYILKANISTKYKVNSGEQKQIINNVKQALYTNFNANKVEFGEEIPYDTLVDVLKNSDTRIKNVMLDDPTIEYYICKSFDNSGAELKQKFDPSKHIDIILDNIKAGSLPLYGEDTSFKYDYNMNLNAVNSHKNLCAIDAQITIQKPSNDGYTLKTNEAIQLVEDSYITELAYPAYIYYAFSTDKKPVGDIAIGKDQTHRLGKNETLYIHYTDSSDELKYIKYGEGTVIKANFDIVNTQGISQINTDIKVENKAASKFVNFTERKSIDITYKTYTDDPSKYASYIPLYSVGTNEQIDILRRNEVNLPIGSSCFWYIKPRVGVYTEGKNPVINERGDLIFSKDPYNSNIYYYILEEGEFFIYPNDDMTSLNILTSGTKIEITKNNSDVISAMGTIKIPRSSDDIINISDLETSIEDGDVGTFKKSFKWQIINRPLNVVESAVSTFIEGDTLNSFGDLTSITKNWSKIKALKINNESVSISEETHPLVRSLLSITCSSQSPQKILDDQIVYLYTSDIGAEKDGEQVTISREQISINNIIQVSSSLDSYNDMIVLQDILYEESSSDNGYKPQTTPDGYYLHNFTSYKLISYTLDDGKYNLGKGATIQNLLNYAKEHNISLVTNSRDEYLIPFNVLKDFMSDKQSNNLTCTSNISNMYINVFNNSDATTTLLTPQSGTFTCDVSSIITNTGTLYISKPKVLLIYNYLNYLEKLQKGTLTKLLDKLKTETKFDWIGPRNNSKIIDSYDPLYSFFNVNNIYNKFTLPKIDFDQSEFNIVGSSKL